MKEEFFENNDPIDAVVTWVDGSDPAHQSKMLPFLNGKTQVGHPGTNPVRFGSVGEITYCVLSILRFAPFVRNIFIVTDNQTPQVFEAVKKHFPARAKDIIVVDHQVIFDGYNEFLPTFNSISIETMLWRIPGLANNYIYFNDDTFLLRPTTPTDWFKQGRPVLRGKWCLAPYFRIWYDNLRMVFIRKILGRLDYEPRHSFQVTQWISAKMSGFGFRYFLAGHTPHPMKRDILIGFFGEHIDHLLKNASSRFRHYYQFNIASLVYHLELKTGNSNFRKTVVAYMQPRKRGHNYVTKKRKLFEKHNNIKFMCVQEMEACQEQTRNEIFGWLHQTIIG